MNWRAQFNLNTLLLSIVLFLTVFPPRPSPQPLPSSPPPPPTPTPQPDELSQLKTEISVLKRQLSHLSAVTPVAGSLSSFLSDPTRRLAIKDSRFNQLDVFEIPLASAKIVGHIKTGQSYPIVNTQNNWHQIQLPSGEFAWIQADLVTEL